MALFGPSCCPAVLLPEFLAGLDDGGPLESGAEERRGVLTRQGAGAEIAGADGDRLTPMAWLGGAWCASIFLGGELRKRGLLRRTVSQPSESSSSTAMGSKEALFVRLWASGALGPFTLSAQLRPLELLLSDRVDPLFPSSPGLTNAFVVRAEAGF